MAQQKLDLNSNSSLKPKTEKSNQTPQGNSLAGDYQRDINSSQYFTEESKSSSFEPTVNSCSEEFKHKVQLARPV